MIIILLLLLILLAIVFPGFIRGLFSLLTTLIAVAILWGAMH